ncbi:uncharacterized protein [Rutidosis leptorrhynchoides]|uniref:uncharacterized protein n=1 Tax=Rutidosis leptorrhynchoides TaxID=125765 RepID=UPI003A997407
MKILSWNIRSFGGDESAASRVNIFKKLRVSEQPGIVVIQESKCDTVSSRFIEIIWGDSNFDFVQKPKVGKSGGLITIWDPGVFKVNESVINEFFLAIKGHWTGRDMETVIVNVYGPHNDSDKKKMWDSLEKLMSYRDVSWVVCGDFNEVRDISKRKNCEFNSRRAKMFNDFIENMELIEIPLIGKNFTRISDDGLKLSKLDRFLVSDSFLNLWGGISTFALDRNTSDHCPIILSDKNEDYGPKPFKVFNLWFEEKEVEKLITDTWKL